MANDDLPYPFLYSRIWQFKLPFANLALYFQPAEITAALGSQYDVIISARIGLQEHVELRANDVTVKVTNGGRYFAENIHRIIRTKRINRLSVLTTMQKTIFRKILSGQPGDSIESVQRSRELMLDLEEMYQRP